MTDDLRLTIDKLMKKILATLIFTATSLALLGQGKQPDWVNPDYRARKYPKETYYTGFAEDVVDGRLSEVRERVKAAARADLVEKITTHVASTAIGGITSVDVNGKLVESSTFVTETITKSFAEIVGSVPELWTDPGDPQAKPPKPQRVYAFVYVKKQDLIEYYKGEVKRSEKKAINTERIADDLELSSPNSAKEKYKEAMRIAAEVENGQKLLDALAVGYAPGLGDWKKIDMGELERRITIMLEPHKMQELIGQIRSKVRAVEATIERTANEESYTKKRSAYRGAQRTLEEVEKLQQELSKFTNNDDDLQTDKVNRLYIEVTRLLKELDRSGRLEPYNNLIKQLDETVSSAKENADKYQYSSPYNKNHRARKNAEKSYKSALKLINNEIKAEWQKLRSFSSDDLQKSKVEQSKREIERGMEEKLTFPSEVFFFNYRYSPTAHGVSFGVCGKWWGGYAQFRGNMLWEGNFIEPKWIKESMLTATYEGAGERDYFRRSVIGGVMFHPWRSVSWRSVYLFDFFLYGGLGYGSYGTAYVVKGENKTFNNRTPTSTYHSLDLIKGIEGEYGVTLSILRVLSFSAGYSTIFESPLFDSPSWKRSNFGEIHLGVGFKF